MNRKFLLMSFILSSLLPHGEAITQQRQRSPVKKDNTGSISGTINKSSRREPVVHQVITLLHNQTTPVEHQISRSKTDAEGKFEFNNVPVGEYTIAVHTIYSSESDAPCYAVAPGKTLSGDQVKIMRSTRGDPMQIVHAKDVKVEERSNVERDVQISCQN